MSKIRTRKRGKTYSYIFEAGRHTGGKRLVVEKGGYPSSEAAYDAGARAYTDWKHGNIGITDEMISVQAFFTNWLTSICPHNVKASTLSTYDTMIRCHVIPQLGQFKVSDLTPAIMDTWMRNLAEEGLAFESLKLIRNITRQVLNYAVYPGEIIRSNPALYIEVPKNAPKNIIKRTIISTDLEEALEEKYPAGSIMRIPLLLLYHTGMRISEVDGLRWQDINFKERTISVQKQFRYIPIRKGYYLMTPKTEKGVRTVYIDDMLVQELKDWQWQQLENELAYDESYVQVYTDEHNHVIEMSKRISPEDTYTLQDMVCTYERGAIFRGDSIRHRLLSDGINSHSFRHTHTTMLVENGAIPKGIASRLGHASTKISQDLYTHVTKKMQKDTAQIFEKIMQTNSKCRQDADK